jgi:hypothetical protein
MPARLLVFVFLLSFHSASFSDTGNSWINPIGNTHHSTPQEACDAWATAKSDIDATYHYVIDSVNQDSSTQATCVSKQLRDSNNSLNAWYTQSVFYESYSCPAPGTVYGYNFPESGLGSAGTCIDLCATSWQQTGFSSGGTPIGTVTYTGATCSGSSSSTSSTTSSTGTTSGDGSTTSGTTSGDGSTTSGTTSGDGSTTSGTTSGDGSTTSGTTSGDGSTTSGDGSTTSSTTTSTSTTTSGDGSTTTGDGSTSTGDGSTTSGDGSTTSGDGSTTSGDGSTTSGDGSTTTGDGSTSTGDGSTTSGDGSTTSGDGSTTSGDGSTGSGDGSGDGSGSGSGGSGQGDGSGQGGTDDDGEGNATAGAKDAFKDRFQYPEIKADNFYKREKKPIKEIWDENKDEFKQTALLQALESLKFPDNGGSCPAWTISIWNIGDFTLAPDCWVFDAIRAIIIVTAIFTARRLIFGG